MKSTTMPLDRTPKRLVVSVGRFLLLLGLMGLSWQVCGGREASTNPRCAWIAVSEGPVLALAETRILAGTRAIWLERVEIDRLLAERKLQEVFGAEAVSERIGLGKVLKADVLVLARIGRREEQSFAELVVAETGGGMRILSRQIPLSDDAEADAAKLCELVGVGLKKHGETIREVYAVSPFLCQELGYEHDHLRSAYPRLLEELLLAQSGVLVVELKEAEAIAKEYALADPEGRPARRLPIYVLGEFRHEGREEPPRVQITIRTQRGEQVLEESSHLVLPASVPDLFREITARWHESRGGVPMEPDVAAEVRTLASRVEELSRLGQWRDVLDLSEATLLLAPDQLDLRYKAIRAARLELRGVPVEGSDACEKRVSLGARALEHAKMVTNAGIPEPDLFAQAFYFAQTIYGRWDPPVHPAHIPWGLHEWERVSEEFVEPLTNLAISERQVSRQLADRYAELENWYMWEQCILHATDWKLPQQRYADRAAAVLQHQQKLPEKTIKNVCRPGRLSVEGDQILATLAESPQASAAVRAAVQKLLDERERYRRSFPERPPSGPASSDPPVVSEGTADRTTLTFRPIELECPDFFFGRREKLQPDFWQALPGDIDLLAESQLRVLLLKQRGLVRPIGLASRDRVVHRISYPSYDGKYVWIARNDAVFVLDPVSERVWPIDTGDGLPDLRMDPDQKASSMLRLRVVGISPGKALAVGFNGRTWYAMIDFDPFDPQGEHKVDILHEARESSDHRDTQGACNYLSPQAAFLPGNLHFLRRENSGSDASGCILVGRQSGCGHFVSYPAIFDLDSRTVRISREPMPVLPDGYFYFFLKSEQGKFDLAIREPPDGAVRTILPNVSPGHVVVEGDEVHIAGREWWKGSVSGKNLQSCGPVPWKYTGLSGPDPSKTDSMEIRFARYSNHYGPCVRLYHPKHGSRILQVLLDGSGLSYEKAITKPDVPDRLQRDEPVHRTGILACYRPPEKPEILWEGGSRDCRDLVFTPDGKHILTARRTPGQGLRLWEASTGRLVADLLEGEPGVGRIAMSHCGKYLATGSDDGSVMVWSTSQWTPIHHLEGHRGEITSLAFSWDERRIAASSQDREVRIWEVATDRELVRIADKATPVGWIGFTSDDTRLITSRQDGVVEYWSSHDGTFLSSVESINWIGGFTADRKLLAVANNLEHSLIVWDTEAEAAERLPFRAAFVPHALSQDGRRMVFSRQLKTAHEQGVEIYRVWVWDFPEKKEVFAYSGSLAYKQFRFSPDGNTLFVLGESQPPWRFGLPASEEPSGTSEPPSAP